MYLHLPSPSTIYRDNFFQGKSYEIKQDALRDECGSVPRLLFLRRDSFKFFLEDKEDFHLRSAKPSSTVKVVLGPDLEQRRFSPRVEPRKLPYSVYSASALQQGKFLVTLASKQSRVWFHFQIKESNLNSLNQLSLMFHKFHSDNPEYSFLKFYTLQEYQGKLYIRSVIIASYRRGYWYTLIIMNC